MRRRRKRGAEFQAIGVTKGGRNCKIHAIVDEDRSPWVLILTQDVPAVYTPPRDPCVGLVCLDEATKQLIKETRDPVPMKPGQPARFDYEHERI